jgi:hypothetical protein
VNKVGSCGMIAIDLLTLERSTLDTSILSIKTLPLFNSFGSDSNEEPNKGRVLIDDIDISKVELSRVRRSIAIIP